METLRGQHWFTIDALNGSDGQGLGQGLGVQDGQPRDGPGQRHVQALEAAGLPYEMHLYPGTQHGFNNDTTPRYDVAAASLAWARTLRFFNTHLMDRS